MSHRLHCLILAWIISVFTSGCNSHATFPENNANNANNVNNQHCGNTSLDPGEACDLNEVGEALIPDGDSCQAHGYDGGVLDCTPSCELITSGCFHDEPACDPFSNQGCDGGLSCYYTPWEGFSCNDKGNLEEGESCGSSSVCREGLTCYRMSCHGLCRDDQDCEGANSHCRPMPWPSNLGYCDLPSACDPVTAEGCDAGKACFLENSNGSGICGNPGLSSTYEPCTSDGDCVAGHTCLEVNFSERLCIRLCKAQSDCFANELCAITPGVRAGFCVENQTCEYPVSCDGSRMCTFVNEDSGPTCLLMDGETFDPQPEWSWCNLWGPCEPGLYCAMSYDGRCHRTCQTAEECGEDFCHFPPGWGGEWGYCRAHP